MRKDKTARKIPLGRRSVTGHYVTRQGADVEYESGLERDCLLLCDYDPVVLGIREQPLRIGKHVPDFRLETKLGPYIVDVKPESKLLQTWDSDKMKYGETAVYCEQGKITYSFFTDAVRYGLSNRLRILKYVHEYGRDVRTDISLGSTIKNILKPEPIAVNWLCKKFGGELELADKKCIIARLVYLGQLEITETPTSFFEDAVVAPPSALMPIGFLIPYERVVKRVETHPMKYLAQSKVQYFPGMTSLELGDHRYSVLDSSNPVSVLIKSDESEEEYWIALDTLPGPSGRMGMLALQEENSNEYFEVVKRAGVIGPLAQKGGKLTDEEKRRAASLLQLSERQIERFVKRYRGQGIEGLLRPETQGGTGTHRAHPEIERMVQEIVERRKDPKSQLKLTGKCVHDELKVAVDQYNKNKPLDEQLKVPSLRSMYYWVNAISPRARMAKLEGVQAARNKFDVHGGEFPDGSFPLQTALIDHSPLDLLVKAENGKTKSSKIRLRPYLTVMIDAYSRVILSYALNFKQPDANQVGLVILDCAKKWGIPSQLHFDNGKDFRSKQMIIGATDKRNNMCVMYRPVHDPKYGGIIERAIRTIQENYVHELPGTMKSSPDVRADYNPVKGASLGEDEIEKILDLAITQYHNTPHKGLGGLTPLQMWEQGVKLYGNPRQLAEEDRHHFRVSFLPVEQRTVTHVGINLFGIKFYSDKLSRFMAKGGGKQDRTVIVRYDPTDITREVYILDPRTGEYITIPSQIRGEPYSLHEWLKARAILRKQMFSSPSERAAVEAYKKRITILEENAKTSKHAAKELHGVLREQKNGNHAGGGEPPNMPAEQEGTAEFVPNPDDLNEVVVQQMLRPSERRELDETKSKVENHV